MWNANPTAFVTPVYGPATKAAAFADLDLAPTIGSSGTFLCKLAITCTSAHTSYVSARPDGNTTDFDVQINGSHGSTTVEVDQNTAASIDVVCVGSKVEWLASNVAATLTVYLLGWADVTSVDPTKAGAASIVGQTYPVAGINWAGAATMDLSAVSNDDTLFMLEQDITAGFTTDPNVIRAFDDAELITGDAGAERNGPGAWRLTAGTEAHGVPVVSDNAGKFQTRRPAGAGMTVDVWVHAYINTANFYARKRTTPFVAEVPPTASYGTLSFAGQGFPGKALLYLRVKRPVAGGGAGTHQRMAFRQKGDPLDYVLSGSNPGGSQFVEVNAAESVYVMVPTDENGEIEWISSHTYPMDIMVMGYVWEDLVPTFSGLDPFFEFVYPNEPIEFNCADDVDVVQATIDLDVTRPGPIVVNVIINGVIQAPYTGTITANASNGFDVIVDPIPMEVGAWSAVARVDDTIGQTGTSPTWNWIVVTTGPGLVGVFPVGVVTDLDRIHFSIRDQVGLVAATIIVRAIPPVGPTLVVYTAGAFVGDWAGLASGSGALYGTNPTTFTFDIQSWPDDFVKGYPERWTFEVAATTIIGEIL